MCRQLLNVRRSEGRQSMGLAFVSDLDVECQTSFGFRVAAIVNLRQHFVAKIQSLTLDPWLFWRHQQSHECRRSGRLAAPLSELGNLIELPDTWFLSTCPNTIPVTTMTAIPVPRRHAVVFGAFRNSASLM